MRDGRFDEVLIPMPRVETWMDRVKWNCGIEKSRKNSRELCREKEKGFEEFFVRLRKLA